MNIKIYHLKLIPVFLLSLVLTQPAAAQRGRTHWAADGYQYYRQTDKDGIVELDTRDASKKIVLISTEMLTPAGKSPLKVANFSCLMMVKRC